MSPSPRRRIQPRPEVTSSVGFACVVVLMLGGLPSAPAAGFEPCPQPDSASAVLDTGADTTVGPPSLDARFRDDGIALCEPTDGGGAPTRVRFAAWGMADAVAPAVLGAFAEGPCPGMVASDGIDGCLTRTDVDRGGLTEWWRRRGDALEQGWTVAAPPEGSGPLAVVVAFDGMGAAVVGDDTVLLSVAGATRYRYSGLSAVDASGRPLASWFESRGPSHVAVLVDVERAEWPVTIDPTLAPWQGTVCAADADCDDGVACTTDTCDPLVQCAHDGAEVLVSWWRAEDLTDSVGPNDGVEVGAVPFVEGVDGLALATGGGNYVRVPGFQGLDRAEFSFEAWVRTTAGWDWNTVASLEDDARPDPWSDRHFSVGTGNAGGACGPQFLSMGGTTGGVCGDASGRAINDGAWHFVAATYDGATGRIYVDGVLEGSADFPPPPVSADHELRLGNDYSGFELDDVKVWAGARRYAVVPAQADADCDGTADAVDGCPGDPTKRAAGLCGCGVPDDATDTDGDGTADCNDGCAADPAKIAPGVCGCGVADTDTDGDGTADCDDGCPEDPDKVAAGLCGCADAPVVCNDGDRCTTDACVEGTGCVFTDAAAACDDGQACTTDGCDPVDGCTFAGAETLVSWWKADGDLVDAIAGLDGSPYNGAVSFVDGVRGSAVRIEHGVSIRIPVSAAFDVRAFAFEAWVRTTSPFAWTQIGAKEDVTSATPWEDRHFYLFVDSPGTGSAAAAPGGVVAPASAPVNDGLWHHVVVTSDGVDARLYVDGGHHDTRPLGPMPVGPSQQLYLGGNGTVDLDEIKFWAGARTYAATVTVTDADCDGWADAADGCPADPAKVAAGPCGCGVADTDTDGDGTADCNDGCDADPAKIAPGSCGCGVADTDTDGDGTPDCNDGCPSDPAKVAAGSCGCGVADTDTDGDGTPDCNDGCPNDATKVAAGTCGCGVADADTDGDGTADCDDDCPDDPDKTAPGLCGCGTSDVDYDGDGALECALASCWDIQEAFPALPDGAYRIRMGAQAADVWCDMSTDGGGWTLVARVPDTGPWMPGDGVLEGGTAVGAPGPDPGAGSPFAYPFAVMDFGDFLFAVGDGSLWCVLDKGDVYEPNPDQATLNALVKASGGAAVVAGGSTNILMRSEYAEDPWIGCEGHHQSNIPRMLYGEASYGGPHVDYKNAHGGVNVFVRPSCDGRGTLQADRTCVCDAGWAGLTCTAPDADGDGVPDASDGCPADAAKIAPGLCGCGVSDTDTDGDGTADCDDGCAADPAKTAPGVCGCGVADTDTDADGTADCDDGCPTDPAKTAAGVCGCGVADTDSDADGTADCDDGCPDDAGKIAAGLCGCGVADTDTDADGTPDCLDGCPTDPAKTAAGVCGCGVPDTDTDGDGTADCDDGCPTDAAKTAGGACGCGVADTDTDGDGTADCDDGCDADPAKTAPGQCGCGVADTDGDGDGTADCDDGCPGDAGKTAAGTCGCGTPDTDTDGDGTPDCLDGCPTDPAKLTAGTCGCGTPDADTDADGTPDCLDGCPTDPGKLAAGPCGCGTPDTDTDGDGTPDCLDGCPTDPAKIAVGPCGCGTPDTDADGDGAPDCVDACPTDPAKLAAGLCGCGVADTDTDGDGAPDCTDACDADPAKTAPGICGCGVADTDTDGDGTADCDDACGADPAKTAPGLCGCGVADTDTDGDGTPDCSDACAGDPAKTAAGVCGCGTPDVDYDGDGAFECPLASCWELREAFPSLPDGAYPILLDGAPTDVWCDMTTDGGGWTLVARVAGSGGWMPGDGVLAGGQVVGAPAPDPAAAASFAYAFGSVDFGDILFAAGDGAAWGVIGRDDVATPTGSSAPNTLVKASFGTAIPAGGLTNVLHRAGAAEDPWVGFEGDHGANTARMLYGENAIGVHTAYKNAHGGVNVFVRPACDGHGTPQPDGTCLCEYGLAGPTCRGIDLCPDDPDKIAPGVCGCGAADGDWDGDGVIDCAEQDFCAAPDNDGLGCADACGHYLGVCSSGRCGDGGLRLWLRSDRGLVFENGVWQVTRWEDQSGHGNHVVSDGAPPWVAGGAVNGLPAVRFAPGRLVGAAACAFDFGPRDFTWIVVARDQSTASRSAVFGTQDSSPTGDRAGFTAGFGAGRTLYGMVRETYEVRFQDEVERADGWIVGAGVRDDGGAALVRNGRLVARSVGAAGIDVDGGRIALGAPGVDGLASFLGDVAELRIYDHALTEAERRSVEAELSARWGVPLDPPDCQADAECADASACTTSRCVGGVCVHDDRTTTAPIAKWDAEPVTPGGPGSLSGCVDDRDADGVCAHDAVGDVWYPAGPTGGLGFSFPDGPAVTAPSAALAAQAFTVEAQLRVGATFPADGVVMESVDASGATRFAVGLRDGAPYLAAGGARLEPAAAQGADIRDARWHHVAATFDGATGRVFLDRKLVASGALAVPAAATASFRFGRGALELDDVQLSGGAFPFEGLARTTTDDEDCDGVIDAVDRCDGVADGAQVDRDGDGAGDACDDCPTDAALQVSTLDFDEDGVLDCNDGCPALATATAPGVCGCGGDTRDADGDGVVNCEEADYCASAADDAPCVASCTGTIGACRAGRCAAGLLLWLRADSGQTIQPDWRVTRWEDRSGHGNHVAGAVGPYIMGGAVNGQPAMVFAGERLVGVRDCAVDLGAGDLTWFAVVRPAAGAAGGAFFGTVDDATGVGVDAGVDAVGRPTARYGGPGGVTLTAPSGAADTWTVLASSRAAGRAQLYRDGVVVGTAPAAPNVDGGLLAIGASGAGLAADAFHGLVAEIRVYDRALGGAERHAIETDLAARYGVALAGVEACANDAACDDANPCSADTCDLQAGACSHDDPRGALVASWPLDGALADVVGDLDGVAKRPADEDYDGDGVRDDALLPSCWHILDGNPGGPDGAYPILLNGVRTDVWCDMTTDGGGWTLVLRHKPWDNWISFDSDLRGAAACGVPPVHPQSGDEGALEFDALPFGDFLFATGDGALQGVLDKEDVWALHWEGDPNSRVKYSRGTAVRAGGFTNVVHFDFAREQPWIGFEGTHDQNKPAMLFGENGDANYLTAKNTHGGANVFVRPYCNGHGVRQPDGSCVCDPGWSGAWTCSVRDDAPTVDYDGDGVADDPLLPSCWDIQQREPGLASGVYPIAYGARVLRVYCDLRTDGGGWTLVAHTPATGGWFMADGLLNGTKSIGTPTPDPHAPVAHAFAFASLDHGELLFAAGDGSAWGVLDAAYVYAAGSAFTPNVATVATYGTSVVAPGWTNVLNRGGQPEDPWIGFEGDHAANTARMLFGENGNQNHVGYKNAHGGANVFVRPRCAGHGTRQPDGSCVCRPGWSGATCAVAPSVVPGTSLSWVDGVEGTALRFAGGLAVDVAPGDGPAAFTFEVWARTTSATGWNTFARREDGARTEPFRDRQFYLGTGALVSCGVDRVEFSFTVGGVGGQTASVCGQTVVTDGVWHHVAITHDGATARLFVDGRLDGSTSSPTPPHGANQRLVFGGPGSAVDLDGARYYAGARPYVPSAGAAADADCDGVVDTADGCGTLADARQLDTDGDGVGDACDACPRDPSQSASGAPFCRTGRSCSELHTRVPAAPDGVYWIDPGNDGSSIPVYCDMTTDGGGWTLAAWGEGAWIGGPLTVARAGAAPDVRTGRANLAAVALARDSSEVAYSWSASGLPVGGIASYERAVAHAVPNPAQQTLAPRAGGFSCADPAWTAVAVRCLRGPCALPSTMYTRAASLGAAYGASYGLVQTDGVNPWCDWGVDGQGFEAVYLGTSAAVGARGVVYEPGGAANHVYPSTMALWFRSSDRDGDGISDGRDGCPDDFDKTSAGACGCGLADTDSDSDGVADCGDGCPLDPGKVAPGSCGCGVADPNCFADFGYEAPFVAVNQSAWGTLPALHEEFSLFHLKVGDWIGAAGGYWRPRICTPPWLVWLFGNGCIDLGTYGGAVNYAAGIELGLDLRVDASFGEVDARYPVAYGVRTPSEGSFGAGEAVAVSSSWRRSGEASLDVDGSPELSMGLYLTSNHVLMRLHSNVCIGWCFDIPIVNVDMPRFEWMIFGIDAATFLQGSLAYDFGFGLSAELGLPVLAFESSLEGDAVVARAEDPFFIGISLEFLGFLREIKAFGIGDAIGAILGETIQGNGWGVSYYTFLGETTLGLTQREEVRFTPAPQMSLRFSRPVAWSVAGRSGNGTETGPFDAAATVQVTLADETPVRAYPTYHLHNTTRRTGATVLGQDLHFAALAASFWAGVPPFQIALSLGPVWEWTMVLWEVPLGNFFGPGELTWTMGGFAPIAGAPFDLVPRSGALATCEWQANERTAFDQAQPAVALDGRGDVLVAWTDNDQLGDNGKRIVARRFDASGQPLGAERVVSVTTPYAVAEVAVAAAPDGRAVVVWTTNSVDGSGLGVSGRRLDAAGVPRGPEFIVTQRTLFNQVEPAVAMAADGSFVVAWRSPDASDDGVWLRRFAPDGTPRGGDVPVNTTTAGEQSQPSVAVAPDGAVVVAWQSGDGSGHGVHARRFDAAGFPVDDEQRVNVVGRYHQDEPAVAMAADGRFVVAWTSDGQDGALGGVYARRFGPDGAPLSGDIHVSVATAGDQKSPAVAMAATGAFAVAWQSMNQDGSSWGVYGHRFDAAGVSVRGELHVSSQALGAQWRPAVAASPDGALAFVWQSDGQDGAGAGIFGQSYAAAGGTLCPLPCATDAECDDGRVCTGAEFCDQGACAHAGLSCADDGLACNGVEICDESQGGCVSVEAPCDDGIACTRDDCDPVTGACAHTPDDGACDDGRWCSGQETCDPASGCVPGAPACPIDGVWCNGVERCDEGADACVAVRPCAAGEVCDEDGQLCAAVDYQITWRSIGGFDWTTPGGSTPTNPLYLAPGSWPTAAPAGAPGATGPTDALATAIAIDGAGAVSVTGRVFRTDTWDWGTLRLDADASFSWARTLAGDAGGRDEPQDVVVDPAGDAYVTGVVVGAGTAEDVVTVRYGPDGATVWRATHETAAADVANATALDAAGALFVTGSVGDPLSPGAEDLLTLKIDAAGTVVWSATFAGGAGGADVGLAVAPDETGGVYVAGFTYGGGTGYDLLVVRYDGDGLEVWSHVYDGPTSGDDLAVALAVDGLGDAVVVGTSDGAASGRDLVTLQLGSDGALGWEQRHDGAGQGDDDAVALALDDADTAYVVGATTTARGDRDYAVVAYDAGGALLWTSAYDGAAAGDDVPVAAALVGDQLWVTGTSRGVADDLDWATVRFEATGEATWSDVHAGAGGRDDYPADLAGAPDGAVFVTGAVVRDDGAYHYETVRYAPCVGCVVDEACVAAGTPAPDDPCASCRPAVAVVGWSTRPDGVRCDDGLFCTDGDVCDAGLCLAGASRGCDDANPCTADACDEAAGGCVHDAAAADGAPCDDGVYCTDGDACAEGACVAGPARDCDDGIACTEEACDEDADACAVAYHDSECDDASWCNGAETCAAGVGCQDGTPPDCDDGFACTTDACDESVFACTNTPDSGACDDGVFCNGAETCDPAAGAAGTGCVPGTPPTCDDRRACTVDACDAATDACTHEADDALCDDGVACTTDRCDATGCVHLVDSSLCDDGLWCNGVERCDASLGCVAGGAPACDDGVDCTVDSCDEVDRLCHHDVDDARCDDGSWCTGAEWCHPVQGCRSGAAPDCDDGVACTVDACSDLAGDCTHTADDACCDDGVYCNGLESFDPVRGACAPGAALTCDDQDACTVDTCDEVGDRCVNAAIACDDDNPCTYDTCDVASGCVFTTNATDCDDGDACTSGDTCAGGACVGGAALSCDDGNPCTDDACDPATGCTHTPNTAGCDDGSACTTGDVCGGGVCSGAAVTCGDNDACNGIETCDPAVGCRQGTPLVCDDGNVCNGVESCDPGAGCRAGTPLVCDDGDVCDGLESCDPIAGCRAGTPLVCDDGDVCNGVETCSPSAGCQAGTALVCDDGDVCTDDACDPATGCESTDNTAACDDGDACTTADTCADGACVGGAALGCDDGNPCTDDACHPATGCVRVENAAPCSDGNACTTADTCSAGVCVGGAAVVCDDGNGCTDDTCDPATGCESTDNAASCDDGDACTGGDTCAGGACGGGAAVVCDDGNGCTDDTCDPATGCVFTDTVAPCDDGDACTTTDTCSAGVCVGGPAPVCDDGNECTDDTCDPAAGCVFADNAAPCDDGDACTTADTCAAGVCVGGPAPVCDDGDACNGVETCAPAEGCQPGTPPDCDDGAWCNGVETCDATEGCQPGTAPVCDDGVACTADACDEATDACVAVPVHALCDDGLYCTGVEVCTAVGCFSAGDPCASAGERCDEDGDRCVTCLADADCDDGVGCTVDTCVDGGCVSEVDDGACDDGQWCNGAESCDATEDCQPGTAPACDDGVACTADSCDEDADACVSEPQDGACDDGLFCNGAETCDAVEGCRPAEEPCGVGLVCDEAGDRCVECLAATDCDDGVACTIDECVLNACRNTPNDGACDDGLWCDGDETCDPTAGCQPGAVRLCDDGVACTADSCDEDADACVYAGDDALCDDGLWCNGAETCDATGGCLPGEAPSCDDEVPCTTDACDEEGDACTHTPDDGACDDGDAYNGQETCGALVGCIPGIPPDSDGDGLPDGDEVNVYGTDPFEADTDGDGLVDGTEITMADGGGCPSPLVADSDGDGLLDGAEVGLGTNPCHGDTDEDGVPDPTDDRPLDPGVTSGWMESSLRSLAGEILALETDLFNGPNANANRGRRTALSNRAIQAANAIGIGDVDDAVEALSSLLDKVDGASPPPDWMDGSPAQAALAEEVALYLELAGYL